MTARRGDPEGLSATREHGQALDGLRERVATALEGSAEDVLAAHRAIAAALDADPDDPELRRIHRELVDQGAIARLHALERVRAAVARLRDAPVQIGYPLIEGELLRRRRAAVVTAADGEPESRQANWEIMRWSAYVAAPVLMEGRVVGFLHGDRADGGAPLRAVEREGLWRFGEGFSEVYERAVLRRRLRVERQELRRIASWADGRSAELSDGAIDLARDRQLADAEESGRPPAARSALHDLLTPREVDVLEHLVKGETNAEIARTLIVSEGTVKFHVKNILRKMNVGNRAEATSQYLRLSLRH